MNSNGVFGLFSGLSLCFKKRRKTCQNGLLGNDSGHIYYCKILSHYTVTFELLEQKLYIPDKYSIVLK